MMEVHFIVPRRMRSQGSIDLNRYEIDEFGDFVISHQVLSFGRITRGNKEDKNSKRETNDFYLIIVINDTRKFLT